MNVKNATIIFLILAFLTSGCGYTTGSLLPSHLKNIYVDNFANKIPITEEATMQNRYKTYRPRLEIDVTEAIRDKYIFDGHLRITKQADADMILEGELCDFKREPTVYTYDDNVEQYRIAIFVNMSLKDAKTGKVIWQENNFAGSDYYYTSGSQTKSEDASVTAAIDDLARRVVERTIEVW